mgnify:CR=1 FL=1
MKIKYILIGIFAIFSLSCMAATDTNPCQAKNTKCSYLETSWQTYFSDPKGSFWYCYNIYLCEEFDPIIVDSEKYVQSIKKMEWKSIREVMTDIGKTLCRKSFCAADNSSFSSRYDTACMTAIEKASEASSKSWNGKISPGDDLYRKSLTECSPLADTISLAFKEAAEQEAAKYHKKIIESSSKEYLKASHDLMQTLSNKMGTFLKKLSAIVQWFEGFIKNVYNTWFTTTSNNGWH